MRDEFVYVYLVARSLDPKGTDHRDRRPQADRLTGRTQWPTVMRDHAGVDRRVGPRCGRGDPQRVGWTAVRW